MLLLADLTNAVNNLLDLLNWLQEINNIETLFLDIIYLVNNNKSLITYFLLGFSIFIIILPKLISLIILDKIDINLLYLNLLILLIKILILLSITLASNININLLLVFTSDNSNIRDIELLFLL